jgi:hypothetical protein
MGLITLIPRDDESGQRLQRLMGCLIWKDTIEIFHSSKRFYSRVSHGREDDDIAVILAPSPEILKDLVIHKNLFDGLRIILILPDSDENTVSMGHLLRPRFISYQDQDFSDLALVLQKMRKSAFPNPDPEAGEGPSNRVGAQPTLLNPKPYNGKTGTGSRRHV